ncbi:MAG: thiamine-phosphate kinase [Oligoflexus sp.]
MSEWQLIDYIRKAVHDRPLVKQGIGDDTAVLASHPREILVATDTILEGSHFDLKTAHPEQIGHKAVAVNLSDIAAMGGVAESVLIAISAGPQHDQSFLEALFSGIVATCNHHQVSIVGGDTTAWQGGLAITVTVIGRPHPLRQAILRSGAKPGDLIVVTGPLGDSLASGHHLSFQPRLEEARQICNLIQPTSMIDLSDGLASDLGHICRASGVAAILKRSAIPLAASLTHLPREEALNHALGDGEDFELCFTIAEADFTHLQSLPFPLHVIGHMTEGSGISWDHGEAITIQGFEHQFQKKQ